MTDKRTEFFLALLTKLAWLGNWLFFLVALIECIPILGGFFPGGTLVSVGGFFAAQGYLNVWDIIIFSTLGAIIGDYSGYSLGRFGRGWLLDKKIIKPEFLAKGEAFFKKYGPASIFWGRFIGATRAVVPFVAGSTKMSQRSFLFWNIISAIGWALYNTAVGYFAGNIIATVIKKWSHRLGLILIIVIIVFSVYWLIKKRGQSIWQYFQKQSLAFTNWLLDLNKTRRLSERYPVISDFFQTVKPSRIFGGFLGVIVLLLIYLLTLILDLV